MPPPPNKIQQADDADGVSNNLWVGNLATDVTDSDLMDIFARYGALDSVTSYSSRSFAFVYFKRIEDAKAAKNALQGAAVRGSPIKIEFARPAKPCKQLWVGGITPSVSKEELEEEFSKFGKIEEFRFLRDRNTAFVDYPRLEDASQAMRNMNGKRIRGDQIRVDFLRSQSSRREQWPDSRDGQFQGRSIVPVDLQFGHKRPPHAQSSAGGRKGDGQPSKVLWVGYPPSLQIDEQMLHNAMILFGEIEKIKSFPTRNYSFVEFRSVDEARRAKEGLQGRLFNDPRITIMYSSSDLVSGKDYSGFHTGVKGVRPEMFFNEQFQSPQMDIFGHSRPMFPNNFPAQIPSGGILGPNISVRPIGVQGSFEPSHGATDFNDLAAPHNFEDGNSRSLQGPNWRRVSSPGGMLPSPVPGIRPATRSSSSSSGAWDGLDVNQFQREFKRPRVDGTSPIDDASFPLRNIDNRVMGLDQQYRFGSLIEGAGSGPFVDLLGKNLVSPVGKRVTDGGPGHNDFIWRGIIAKGGTPVCHARCVPLGKGLGSELPEVVNCSARTGLDQLTNHYADAIGFDIVFFLPDSEDDFASYTEFLRYLGAKNRAGVAKFDDGTTLFLVPPSDFLTDVLEVAGPERLYGVVLKFPQVHSSEPVQQHSLLSGPSSQYPERPEPLSSQAEYDLMPSKEEQLLPIGYNRALHDDKVPPKPLFPSSSKSPAVQPVAKDHASNNATTASQAGVMLTPELIATLASFLPGKTQSSTALENAKPQSGASIMRPPFPLAAPDYKGFPSQEWKKDHQSSGHPGHSVQQTGGTPYNPEGQQGLSQFQPHSSLPNPPPFQDSSVILAQHVRPLTNYSTPADSGQLTVSPLVNPQNQHAVSHVNQRGYGAVYGVDSSGYGTSVLQQPQNPMIFSNQSHIANPSQPFQTTTQLAPEKISSEILNQAQQPQPSILGAGPGSNEVEVDKNQRYQSTLQFAANLLLQIQQQQQAARGSGN